MNDIAIARGAVISGCGLYRYLLERHWDTSKQALGFLMLNPSTADAMEDDPTIRRCVGFAKDNGYGSIFVGNLFAWRATDPNDIPTDRDVATGARRDYFLQKMGHECSTIVAAWGAKVPRFVDRAFLFDTIWQTQSGFAVKAKCLGTTKNGMPRHPLYVKADQPLVDFKL